VGDKETFKQDLIDAGFPELADEAHASIIHLDNNYILPNDLPNRSEIASLIAYINSVADTQIPHVSSGINFGPHTVALIPPTTATKLFDAGYGHSKWHKVRIFNSWATAETTLSAICDIVCERVTVCAIVYLCE
jgi:hypothetical protein